MKTESLPPLLTSSRTRFQFENSTATSLSAVLLASVRSWRHVCGIRSYQELPGATVMSVSKTMLSSQLEPMPLPMTQVRNTQSNHQRLPSACQSLSLQNVLNCLVASLYCIHTHTALLIGGGRSLPCPVWVSRMGLICCLFLPFKAFTFGGVPFLFPGACKSSRPPTAGVEIPRKSKHGVCYK